MWPPDLLMRLLPPLQLRALAVDLAGADAPADLAASVANLVASFEHLR